MQISRDDIQKRLVLRCHVRAANAAASFLRSASDTEIGRPAVMPPSTAMLAGSVRMRTVGGRRFPFSWPGRS
jgi:hypothetical protein